MRFKLNKVAIAFLLIVIFLSNSLYENKCYAATITLSQIAEKFKTSDFVKEYESASNEDVTYDITTSVNETTFIINFETTGYSEGDGHAQSFLTMGIISFNLENDILTSDETTSSETVTMDIAKTMISCVAQLHGYTEDFINEVLNREEITDYTVENEGFEIKYISKDNNDEVSVKINLKQMNLPENKDNEEDKDKEQGEENPTEPSQEENKKDEQEQSSNEKNNIEDNTIVKQKLPNAGVLNVSVILLIMIIVTLVFILKIKRYKDI